MCTRHLITNPVTHSNYCIFSYIQLDKMEQNKQVFEAQMAICKKYKFVEFFATSVKTEYNVVNSVEFLVEKVRTIAIILHN